MKKKILVIDFWTKSIPLHIAPLKKYLDPSRYEVVLLNFAYLAGNSVASEEQIIDGVHCYDFRYFKKLNIASIMGMIGPSVVIILNYNDLLSRAFLRVAKKRRIPTIFIQHGSFMTHVGFSEVKAHLKGRYTFTKALNNFYKYLFYFYNYVRASIVLDSLYLFTKELYIMLYQALFEPVKFVYYPDLSKGQFPAVSYVYGQKDKEFLISLGYPRSSIQVIGSMIFENALGLAINDDSSVKEWCAKKGLNPAFQTVLHLPSNLVEWGVPGWTREKFHEVLTQIADVVQYSNANLIIKLHPAADFSLYQFLEKRKNVLILKEGDLTELANRSAVVLADWTNAIMPAIILKKPLIFLQFIHNAHAGFDYAKYGLGITIKDKETLTLLLADIKQTKKKINYAVYDSYLNDFCKYGDDRPSKIIGEAVSQLGSNENTPDQ